MSARRLALTAFAALLGLAIWRFASLDPLAPHAALDAPAPLAASAKSTAAPALEFSRVQDREQAPLEAESAAKAPASVPPFPALLRAHCIDEQGQPIEGVRLMALGQIKPLALSTFDGRLTAAVAVERAAGTKLPFDLVEDFHVHCRFERVLEPGKECDLGEVVMKLGARIRGSVVDGNGKPIAQAWVWSSRKRTLSNREANDADASYARSSVDGSFVLDGVPAGTRCVSANADRYEAAEQTGLELVLGRELTNVVLTLEPESEAEDSGLLVHVVDPSGKPVNGMLVLAELHEGGHTSTSMGATDERGERRITAAASSIVNVEILDELFERFPPAFAVGVPVSQRTLEVQLEQGAPNKLLVVDEHDAPVENYAVRLLYDAQYQPAQNGQILRDGHGLLRDLFIGNGLLEAWTARVGDHRPQPGGRADISVASHAFVVQVDAGGFAPGEAGPFQALGAQDEIRIVLKPLPGIRGHVVAQGKPVEGAWVKLFRASRSGDLVLAKGFPSRLEPVVLAQTKTAADGRFELALRDAGRYMLQAGHAELGEAESGALELEPRGGAEGIVLELPALGAIEGRLLVSHDEDARDRVVGASRGDGRVFSKRTDEAGRFRFEQLTPGAWLLRPLAEDVDPAGEGYEVRSGAARANERASTCDVRAAETTRVEIDLRQQAVWLGRVELAGWAAGQWTGTLEPEGASFSRKPELKQVPAEELRMVVDQPGDYALQLLVWKPELKCNLSFNELVHLDASENPWVLGGAAGELAIVNTLGDEVYPELVCELAGGRHARLQLDLAAHAQVTLVSIPAGHWTRVHYDKGQVVEDGSIVVTSAAPARLEWK